MLRYCAEFLGDASSRRVRWILYLETMTEPLHHIIITLYYINYYIITLRIYKI